MIKVSAATSLSHTQIRDQSLFRIYLHTVKRNMAPPNIPYQPYAKMHETVNGPGDARPTSLQVIEDNNAVGSLAGRTVLITGCSSGVGVETARALYETGATLFLTARDMPKLESAIEDIVSNAKYNKSGPKPRAIEIHLDSFESVRQGIADFQAKSRGELNILINNAGVMRTPYGVTKDGLETQLGVNHFAHFLLFQLLKALLLTSAKRSGTTSRVINLSSAGHRWSNVKFTNRAELDAWNAGEGYEKTEAYGQSKTANIHMANSIARHHEAENLLAWSVHPGAVWTELVRHMTPEEHRVVGDRSNPHPIYKSPDQGAATTVWAATSPHFEGKNGGRYLADVGEAGPLTDDADITASGYGKWAYDEEAEERLWKLSEEIVGVSAV